MKYLLATFLLLCSLSLFAQDSGLYYDADRDGEGINLTRNGDLVQFYFYTYTDHQGCYGIEVPKGGLVTPDNCNEPIWFLTGGDDIDSNDKIVTGYLYMPVGLDYDAGIPDPKDPFKSIVGEAHIAGLFVLQRYESGWRLAVVRFGELLPEDHPLYSRIFEFTTPLLKATD